MSFDSLFTKKKSAISQLADQLQQIPVSMAKEQTENRVNFNIKGEMEVDEVDDASGHGDSPISVEHPWPALLSTVEDGPPDSVMTVSSSQMSGMIAINETNGEKSRKFLLIARKAISVTRLAKFQSVKIRAVVDGERQQVSPVTTAWFLGPKAENEKVLKDLVDIAIDSHVDFRKFKYFPLDPNYVTKELQKEDAYTEAVANMKRKLRGLSRRLNNSVPFFNFRSQGHMLWDTTIPSNVGYIAALLYNQNNVSSMASGVTLQLEREAAADLCSMVGYNVYTEEEQHRLHSTEAPGSWGHLPNGGTVANLEAMWAARCLKFNGLALQKLMKEKFVDLGLEITRDTFKFKNLAGEDVLLRDADAWELLNIPVDEAIDLFDKICKSIKENESVKNINCDDLFGHVKEYTMEELGAWEFFQTFSQEYQNAEVRQGGRWFAPGSRHYSWDKGANILGLGRKSLIKIPVDNVCRVDIGELEKNLQECLDNRIPVLGVTAVFGTTQEGAVDQLDKILQLREKFEQQGLTFYIHIDGAWGGYFASTLHMGPIAKENEQYYNQALKPSLDRSTSNSAIFNQAKLSSHFQLQLRNLHRANSITLDPHKSGFCPYPAGGLLYRNGNIRKFLAQKAAYVSHGSGKNEEINLFGIDGSKPGAASAGVWLSHKVIGLHDEGYGLLLQQCTFSAGIMYAMWVSMEHPQDPFSIQHAVPVQDKWNKWTKDRIRREILEADNSSFENNFEAMEFLTENGPDSLINCISLNIREWNSETSEWQMNSSMEKQRDFHKKFIKRCGHCFEKPSMVDRGIQIILNSTVWEKETHSGAYNAMKERLGLDLGDESCMSVIINTCMSPWLRAQKTFKRIGTIIRNEMYNAYGAINDKPQHLKLVSPCLVNFSGWNGEIFAELEASFSNKSLSYHCIGSFFFEDKDLERIGSAACEASQSESETRKFPLRIITRKKMTVFDLMTNSQDTINQDVDEVEDVEEPLGTSLEDKLKQYSDDDMEYDDIAMPEIPVTVYFGDSVEDCLVKLETKVKLKRVIRYHHLDRDFVDECDFPPTQEYMLYASSRTCRVCNGQHTEKACTACNGKKFEKAYLSHCPNRWPDFQQLIVLDEIPKPYGDQQKPDEVEKPNREKSLLYQEALERGVVVHLPQVLSGGRPVMSRKKPGVCKDPLKDHAYDAISWSDQGAYTGDMATIKVRFYNDGKRWFNGDDINQDFDKQNFPHLYDENGQRRRSEGEGDESEEE